MTSEDAQLFVQRLVVYYAEAVANYETAQTALATAQSNVESANQRLTAITAIKNSALQLSEIPEAIEELQVEWP